MTDQSPEPRDPWAPPERPAVELGKPQATHGTPGTPGESGPPSVHDHPTLAGMPGDATPPPGTASPAYGYPAQPAPAAYGYPTQPPAQPNPGYANYPGYPGGYPNYPGHTGYPPYGPQPRNGFGVTALVLGIISVVGCITSIFAIAIGIGAIVFGALGRGKAKRGEADNGGMALAGIILGSVGILLGALMVVAMVSSALNGKDQHGSYDSPFSNSQVREKV